MFTPLISDPCQAQFHSQAIILFIISTRVLMRSSLEGVIVDMLIGLADAFNLISTQFLEASATGPSR
jgi:hypothetical protein